MTVRRKKKYKLIENFRMTHVPEMEIEMELAILVRGKLLQ